MKYSLNITTNIPEYLFLRNKCSQQFGAEHVNWTSFLINDHTATFKFSQQKYLNWFSLSNYEQHLSIA